MTQFSDRRYTAANFPEGVPPLRLAELDREFPGLDTWERRDPFGRNLLFAAVVDPRSDGAVTFSMATGGEGPLTAAVIARARRWLESGNGGDLAL